MRSIVKVFKEIIQEDNRGFIYLKRQKKTRLKFNHDKFVLSKKKMYYVVFKEIKKYENS